MVAVTPSSRPAAASRNEPEHTLATRRAARRAGAQEAPRGPARERGVGTLAAGDQHGVERAVAAAAPAASSVAPEELTTRPARAAITRSS